jgi:hypothetical protein
MEYTLTYSEEVQGWVSFYSFIPDWMIGMNNYFYSFKGGNLFRHNANPLRNNFYGNQYNSTVQSVFNESPLENKLFKTITIQGDDTWDLSLYSDLQTSGSIQSGWFEKKEQAYFAFIRNLGTSPASPSEYAMRSLGGIGRSTSVIGGAQINFDITIDIGSIISVDDYLYFAVAPNYNIPLLAGKIVQIVKIPAAQGLVNRININTAIAGTTPIILQTPYFLYMKNSIAESHGILGHYGVFTLTNTNINKIELFALESEAMKSYP